MTQPGPLLIGCGAFTGQGDLTLGPHAGRTQADIVDHAERAEAEGFDSFWLGEHHFAPDGYTSAVFPLLGAVAARTRRMILGTRVLLAPLHPALLLAENAAQVAVLSGGRFILGMGIGYRDEEFASLRIPKRERVARLVEVIDVCRLAWGGQAFSYHGPTVDADGIVCRPAPSTPPAIWLGGRAAGALERAGRLADGFVAPLGGLDETLALVDRLDAATPPDRGPLPVCTSRLVALRTGSPMDDVVARGMDSVLDTYRQWKGDDRGINAATVSDLDRGVAAGSPDEVAAALEPLALALTDRQHHLVVRLDYPGMAPEQVAEHVTAFAREVAPRLREVAGERSKASAGTARAMTAVRRNRSGPLVGRAPFRDRKLAEIIAHSIVAEIADRGISAGHVLPAESDMVRTYGVGRATLREALRLLEVQGLISMRPGPGGGPIVARLGAPDFARVTTLFLQVAGATKGEIIAARIELEPCMARLAAESQDVAGLDQLRAELAHAAAMSLDDDAAFQRLSSSFHATVAGISGNRGLDLIGRSLKAIYDLCVPARLLPLAARNEVRKVHVDIASAIIDGRGADAERLMREHLAASRAATARQFPGLLTEPVEWA